MAIKLCWWDSKNLGDALNPYLFKAFGFNVEYAQSDKAEIISVGSYMERLLVGALFTKPQSNQNISVWGTGFQFEPTQHLWFHDIKYPEEFIRPLDIHALRGKLSKARAEAITKQNLNGIALGDPGLLTNKFIDIRNVRKKHRLGIFCHFMDNNNKPVFDNIKLNIQNSVRIDIEAPVTEVIRKMASCEAIISSAMHPLIIADSLRIPNRWVNLSEDAISKYKFYDYYSIFDIKPRYFDLNSKTFDEDDLEQLHADYSITTEQVLEIQNNLIRTFPLAGKLRYLSFIDNLALRYREAIERDKVTSKAMKHITSGWRKGKRKIQNII